MSLAACRDYATVHWLFAVTLLWALLYIDFADMVWALRGAPGGAVYYAAPVVTPPFNDSPCLALCRQRGFFPFPLRPPGLCYGHSTGLRGVGTRISDNDSVYADAFGSKSARPWTRA